MITNARVLRHVPPARPGSATEASATRLVPLTRSRTGAGASATVLATSLFAATAVVTPPALAHEFRVGDLEIDHPSAPPTPPGVTSAAGYLVVVNGGDEDDRLLGGRAPFADDIELHRTTVEDDIARMRRLDDGLPIPAGATVRLDPGATHLMFTGLAEPLPDGERRSVTLVFERAGEVDIEFAIERPGGGEDAVNHDQMDHGEMDHGEMDHGEMDHGEMDHGEMDHGSADEVDGSHGGTNHGDDADEPAVGAN